MSEYSPRPGTVRSYDERAEFEEPCTRSRIGSGVSPALGAPTRLRQRLSATSPFLAQYSPLQIGASLPSPAAVLCACPPRAKPSPAPPPRLAPLRIVRRARVCSGDIGPSFMAPSDLGASVAGRSPFEPFVGRDLIRAPGGLADGTSAIALPRRRTCRSAKSSRGSAHFASRFRPSARTPERCHSSAGLAIGCCNDDMVGMSPGKG